MKRWEPSMSRPLSGLALPGILCLAFFVIAATPVEALGCLNRGIAALAVALISGVASVAAAFRGLRGRVRGETGSGWWMVRSLLLAIPVAALIVLA